MASADYSVGTKVTADVSNFEKGMNKAEKSLKGFSDKLANSIDRLGKKGLIGSVANVTLAMQGLTKSFNTVIKFAKDVGKAINDCTEAYKAQVIAERALDTAIQNNPFISGESSKALKQFASEMQKVTNYGDEELIPMMTNLVSLGRTESEVMQIMSVAMDMSAGMGISLDTAITQLNATLNGNIGRLGQQNAELKDLTEEELKQGKAIEILGEKFKGLSSATADTSKQLQNIKGDFKEALGQFTLPSSDMWNKFWTGFYEQGIKVLGDINRKINELTIGKTLAGAMTGQLGNLSYTGDRIEYLRDAFAMISDEELDAVADYLSSLSKVNDEQKQILERAELEKQRRIDIQKIERQMAEESAKRKKEKEEEAELENGIALLKDKHIQKLKEQEAKWENIKKVTGEDVKLEEKIKFYQDDLVAIMTEAGGQITTNNQYYKDQIKIINALKEQLGLVAETTEDITDTTEEALEVWADLSSDLSKGITEVVKNAQKGLYNVQLEIGKAKETVINDFGKTVSDSFSQMFTMLGENLIGAGHGFENFASVALKALSEVLKSISAQLSAIAVLKAVTHDYANAAIALAGATASMVASGVASQVSKNLTTTKTKIDEVGESANKAGKDLEYFIKRLQEIQSGMTASSRNLVADISKLYTVYQEAKKASNDAYEAYIKENQSGKVKYNALKGFFLDNEKEVRKLQDEWEKLHDKELEALNAVQGVSENVLSTIKAEVSANKDVVKSYKDIYQSFSKLQELKIKKALLTPSKLKDLEIDYYLRKSFNGDLSNNLLYQYEQYTNYVNILLNEQKLNVQKLLTDVYDQLASTGKNIGEKLVNSIINGADKSDFLLEMKKYIRTNMIKIAVFTESFQDKFAEIGALLAKTLNEGVAYQIMDMSKIRSELNELYDSAVAKAKFADSIINTAFGDIGQTVEEIVESTNNGLEDTLSSFEELLKSFKESIVDMGGEIGNQFVDAISNGMNQGDFLQKMKDWIKRMLVQSVVYTESMKAEIEAIGQAITKGIREGFTETSLHEIRRDLSWVFNEANKTISSLDNILDRTFGDIQDTVEETTEQIEESVEVVERTLTRFEELMEGFKDEVADVGGEIGSSFVDAISEGMNQGDFLQKMKGWIKKMLVQSVVYTESMKSEIEAIGQAITKGIREGFTETSLHEIRRDLSWVFNEANKTVSSLDNILDKTFGGYAIGTNNALSGLHLVGEAGPELVRFRGGEQVLNAGNTQKALEGIGGTTINQNVTFNNLQDTTAYAMMNQFKQYNRQMAINGVI